jgi:hypothetical protein
MKYRRRLGWVPVLGAGLLASCNALLGVDDAKLDERRDASAGAAGQTGGAGGSAASGGGGQDGSLGGSAGTAGSGAAGGVAGSGAVGGQDAGDAGECTENLSTDSEHCGACGHSCLGGVCEAGKCKPELFTTITRGGNEGAAVPGGLLYINSFGYLHRFDFTTKQETDWNVGGDPESLTLHDNRAYFLNTNLGDVYRAPLDGTAAPVLYAKVAVDAKAITVDASGLYSVTCPDTTGTLYRSELDGSNSSVLAQTTCGSVLRVDSDSVYVWGEGAGSLQKVKKFGQPGAGTVTNLEFKAPGGYALALDATHVYFATFDDSGIVYRVKKDGTGTQQIATGQIRTHFLMTHAGVLYIANQGTWDTFTDGTVVRAAIGGASVGPAEVVADMQEKPWSLTTDGSYLYWFNGGPGFFGSEPGSIWRVAL